MTTLERLAKLAYEAAVTQTRMGLSAMYTPH